MRKHTTAEERVAEIGKTSVCLFALQSNYASIPVMDSIDLWKRRGRDLSHYSKGRRKRMKETCNPFNNFHF